MAAIRVCGADELAPGDKRTVEVAGRAIVLVRDDNGFHALRALCPHQGAPLGDGRVGGTMIASEAGTYCYGLHQQVLRCPWHGWEFDVRTGQSLHDPETVRVRRYDVTVEDGEVLVDVGGRARSAA